MKICIVGNGGREHALAWKLARECDGREIVCIPGNAGTAGMGTNLECGSTDLEDLCAQVMAEKPDLTVIGPEAPLCAGLTDRLEKGGLAVFGPNRSAARIEASKLFAKEVMEAAGVPTGRCCRFTEAAKARAYIEQMGEGPVVVKADGLAAGKGVYVCTCREEALTAVDAVLEARLFGDAGAALLVEEFLEGDEVSILALTDGKSLVTLATSQDHKRALDGDCGPNTGGMGAYSPAPVITPDLLPEIEKKILEPTLEEMRSRGIEYKGVLYAGLMLTDTGPKVLEFNCRFGDPETQAVLARWDGDMLPALQACVDGTLHEGLVRWKKEAAVCVVVASGGYPGPYEKGKIITGLDEAGALDDTVVFHAGTTFRDRDIVTAGGRVLGVTALGPNIAAAVDKAYRATDLIHFEGMQYRHDIAHRAL